MSNRRNTVSLTMMDVSDINTTPSGVTFSPTEVLASGMRMVMRNLLLIVLIAVIGLGAGYVINRVAFRMVQISGSSMVPTLAEGSRHLVNLWSGRMSVLHRNDIVVFRDPGDHGMSVKRVIAMPGDSILIKNGVIYLNGELLHEDYLMASVHTFTYSQKKEQFITLGVDQYFLLGDNRPVSIDSRAYGPVNRENILGLVDLKSRDGI